MKKYILLVCVALIISLGVSQDSTTYVDFLDMEVLGDEISITVVERETSNMVFLYATDEYGFNDVSFLMGEEDARKFYEKLGEAIAYSWDETE